MMWWCHCSAAASTSSQAASPIHDFPVSGLADGHLPSHFLPTPTLPPPVSISSPFPLSDSYAWPFRSTLPDVRAVIVDALRHPKLDLSVGRSFHSAAIAHGFDHDTYVDNLVIAMYKAHDAVEDARKVFDNMHCPSLVSWNSIISVYAQCGRIYEALEFFDEMQLHHIEPNDRTFVSVLRICANLVTFEHGQAIHSLIISSGYESAVNVGNALLNMYTKCGTLDEAVDIFENMPVHTVTSWSILISAYTANKKNKEAIESFVRMQHKGFDATNVTFINVLKACISPNHLGDGITVHACIIDSSYRHDAFVTEALVHMYGRCDAIPEAEAVFNQMLHYNFAPWNALIIVYTQLGYEKEACVLFQEMLKLEVKADQVTLVSVLAACTSRRALQEGKVIHMCIVDNKYEQHLVVGTALVNFYGKCGTLRDARLVFDTMQHRDVVTWSAMISAYASHGDVREALRLLKRMETTVGNANGIIFLTLLGACDNEESLEDGRLIHAFIIAGGLDSDNCVAIALIDMYGKCRSLEDAQVIFDKMSCHCVVSWTALITACVLHGRFTYALDVFREMQLHGVKVDEVVFTSLIGACSGLSNLLEGRAIHQCIIAAGFEFDIALGNALINMYTHCGALDAARAAFNKLEEWNVVSWTTIISAYAHHGHGKEAVDLFLCMQSECVDANDFTFVSLLSACNHAGLIEEAYFFLDAMINHYKMIPTVEHYNCMIDLLGRAGRLDEAEALINKLPVHPDGPVWTSLINACKPFGDTKRGMQAARCTSLRPSSYVLLANVYAGSG